jgi:hypothetical protein
MKTDNIEALGGCLTLLILAAVIAIKLAFWGGLFYLAYVLVMHFTK